MSLGVAVSGYDAGVSEFMTKMAGAPRESAEKISKWDFTTRVDGSEVSISLSSPHWGAREGRTRRAARAYKNDIWFVVFDLTKDAEHLRRAINIAKRATDVSPHKDHAVYYLVGNKADLVSERKMSRAELEKAASENGLLYAEVSSTTGAGMNELLTSAVRGLAMKPKKPSLEELLNPEGLKA